MPEPRTPVSRPSTSRPTTPGPTTPGPSTPGPGAAGPARTTGLARPAGPSRSPDLSRRAFAAGLGGLGLAALAAPLLGPLAAVRAAASPAASGVASPAADRWRRRALDGYAALQRHLYLPGTGLYSEGLDPAPGENPYSFVWPLREATAATVDVDRLPGSGGRFTGDVADRFAGLERYWDAGRGAYASYPPAPLGGGGDPFFDDNAVIGLELVRRYRMSGDRELLRRAQRVFEFLPRAWDTDPDVEHPGGMHWVEADWNPYRGAANVTSLSSELAVHLYEETGEARYLDWGRRTYEWVRAALHRGDGRYANGILLDGSVEETLWSYNSGSMVGAAALLHRATGEQRYLDLATADAAGAVDHWVRGDRLYDQPVVFNAILFANLLLFESISAAHGADVLDGMGRYAERVWAENRDPATGLFRFQSGGGGAPAPDARPQTLHQAGAIQLFALLAWRRQDYGDAA
ncbi:glycoside hydrolase family 76 protein [Promicromonospora sp. NPDC050880]|uniref:glycoside hydrolase family 76 protein n=1 Tax=Promicromonospora sp. NPDC050880 TaxID=3364406 RepID=UPI0037910D16